MITRILLAAMLLVLPACSSGPPAGPAMTHGTVPRDGRGEPVLSAMSPPPADPLPTLVMPGAAPAVSNPAPGATLR